MLYSRELFLEIIYCMFFIFFFYLTLTLTLTLKHTHTQRVNWSSCPMYSETHDSGTHTYGCSHIFSDTRSLSHTNTHTVWHGLCITLWQGQSLSLLLMCPWLICESLFPVFTCDKSHLGLHSQSVCVCVLKVTMCMSPYIYRNNKWNTGRVDELNPCCCFLSLQSVSWLVLNSALCHTFGPTHI